MDSHFNKKVFITGIEGFTGKHISEYLKYYGYEVYGISSKKYSKQENIFEADILDKSKISELLNIIKPDYIIHLAAVSFVAHDNISEIYNVNVLGSQNILDALLDINCFPKKIILASSATVYGNLKNQILNENLCVNPNNHYGLSKYNMEQIAKNYFDKLDIIITRPFNYTGIGHSENFVIPKIVKHFKEKKENIELGNINVFREYNDVSLICDAYEKLLNSNLKSDIINICSGSYYSINEIITELEKITNHKIKITINPKFIRQNEIIKLKGSNKKLQSIIGNLKSKSLNETLSEMYSYNN